MKIAGIDVHKKVLMVVVMDGSALEEKPARRRFVTLPSELQRFRIWLQEQGVEEAVMESTAQSASEPESTLVVSATGHRAAITQSALHSLGERSRSSMLPGYAATA
jgi:hypothetical protein